MLLKSKAILCGQDKVNRRRKIVLQSRIMSTQFFSSFISHPTQTQQVDKIKLAKKFNYKPVFTKPLGKENLFYSQNFRNNFFVLVK